MRLEEIRRFIIVKVNGREERVETTRCPWCTDVAVCSACSARATALRSGARRGD